MRLKELLTMVNSHLVLETSRDKKTYKTKVDIPDEFLNFQVKMINSIDNCIVIKLDERIKVPEFEELAYSFEVGI